MPAICSARTSFAPGIAAQRVHDAVGGLAELGEIVAVEVEREVGRDAGEEIVRVHLDRLAEARSPRRGRSRRAPWRTSRPGPRGCRRVVHSALGLEHDVDVRHVHAHRIDGDLGATRAADDARDLGEPEERLLDLARLLGRLLERDRRQADHRHDDGALVELGQELAAHLRRAGDAAGEREQRRDRDDLRPAEPEAKRGRVDAPHAPRRAGDGRSRAASGSSSEATAGTSVSESTNAVASANRTVIAIGRNMRPSMLCEREDRHVDERDDHLAERRRAPHLGRGGDHDLATLGVDERPPELLAPLGHAPERVLDDDDRAVDDEAEVDRAEADEVARDAERPHPDERADERERDRHRHDGAGAQVHEREERARRSRGGSPRAGSWRRSSRCGRRARCGRSRRRWSRRAAATSGSSTTASFTSATTCRELAPRSIMTTPTTASSLRPSRVTAP